MARTDFVTPRLFIDAPLGEGGRLTLAEAQSHYLLNVLRLPVGARVLVFNGREGEFATLLERPSRKRAALTVGERLRAQEFGPDLDYLFAPLKHARLDYVAQKAVEMGVRRLKPVMTRRTQAGRVNLERLRANAVEAAEQCGVIWLPEIRTDEPLAATLKHWPVERLLIFCDEEAPLSDPIEALALGGGRGRALALLVGPEGGFEDDEREAILRLPNVLRISLGPRILRADTAAVAALALIQARLGDWG
ncbi:MAG TPA: 16S rRNA (uracil(1498)-N(3))-methyltransferase [Roseiarcus sp.]|nr:16S rRNA (uracil(1498)-N(3))-methyltransferase [Roseiarcus sp.]